MLPAQAQVLVLVLATAPDGTEQPLRDAEVHLKGAGLHPDIDRTARSDQNGNVRFDRVPGGYFIVEAARTGYVTMQFGASRYDVPGTPLALATGEKAAVTISLSKGASIAGTVVTPTGQAAEGVSVSILELRIVGGKRKFTSATRARAAGGTISVTTDSSGAYRLYGLPPGDYGIRVIFRNPVATGIVTAARSVVYFPGTVDLDAAASVQLGAGEEKAGLAVPLPLTTLVRVSGSVIPLPEPPQRIRLVLLPLGIFPNIATAGADGRFSFGAVAPGLYTLWARSVPAGEGPFAADDPGPALWGRTELTVGREQLANLSMPLSASMTFAGRVAVESTTPAAAAVPRDIEVALAPVDPVSAFSHVLRATGRVSGNGEFSIGGVTPGRYLIQARSSDRQYGLLSAVVAGRNVAGVPITIEPDETVRGVVLTLSDARQQLSGVFEDGNGHHPLGYSILLFSADPADWTPQSARVLTTVPATNGWFGFEDLLPGEYQLGAVRNLGPDEFTDPTFLQRLRPLSVSVRIDRGAKLRQNLNVPKAALRLELKPQAAIASRR